MRMSSRLVSVAAAAGLVVAGTTAAHAVDFQPASLPGTAGAPTVVKVDNSDLSVAVTQAADNLGVVTVAVTNNSDKNYVCNVSKEGNTVTDASLVQRSMAYYAGNVYPGAGGGLVDTGSLTNKLGTSSLGSLVGELVDVDLATLVQDQKNAALAGHYGEAGSITVLPKGTATPAVNVNLLQPANGTRTDFNAGALLLCTVKGESNYYAFAGYEDAKALNQQAASTGSLSMGSLKN